MPIACLKLLVWLAAVSVSTNVAGWDRYNPDARFGMTGRRVVAAVFGFGMAGLSASYAGWGTALALAGAAGGAILGTLLAGLLE